MIVLWHERKETANGHNNSLRGAGSGSDCGDQRASWRDLRQCGYSDCTAHDVQRDQAAVHPSQSPNKVGPFIPGLKRLILTQIFGKVLGGRLDKAEILPVSAMRVGLSDPFAKSVWKMWVRIRLKKTGAFWPVHCKIKAGKAECPARLCEDSRAFCFLSLLPSTPQRYQNRYRHT